MLLADPEMAGQVFLSAARSVQFGPDRLLEVDR
jgi:hypothetical protein